MVSRVIPVYIIASSDPHSSHVAKLSALFDCGYFEVSVISCEDDHDNERRAFLYAFNNAKESGKNEPCIIVKDCMFSNLSSNDMYNLIRTILGDELEQQQCGNKFDICYLARYLDKCDGAIVLPDITTGGSLVTTKSAEGDDAIMYSPKARDLLIDILSSSQSKKHKKHQPSHPHQSISDIIQKQLRSDHLKGVATSPPVIQYNPSFGDLQKTWECHKKGHNPDPNKKEDDSSCYTWLPIILLVLILLILLIWFFFW